MLDIAKPMLIALGKNRIQHSDVTAAEEQALQLLVTLKSASPLIMAKNLRKTSLYIGRVLERLVKKGLVLSCKEGRNRFYKPSIDTVIAYIEI